MSSLWLAECSSNHHFSDADFIWRTFNYDISIWCRSQAGNSISQSICACYGIDSSIPLGYNGSSSNGYSLMPRTSVTSAPPLSSAIPPPPVEGTSPLPEMSPSTGTAGSSRMKKGMTAAQLYSLHTIGGGGCYGCFQCVETAHTSTVAENAAENQKVQEVPKEEKVSQSSKNWRLAYETL